MDSLAQQFLTPETIRSYARELDPSGNAEFGDQLQNLELTELFRGSISDSEMAACCHSGLWLLNNFLHQSHDISQSIDSPEGSWWHAIMHRTEGDFSNAKYWYRRVGDHEAFANVGSGFDPFLFVDQCQSDYRVGSLSDESQAIAYAEWLALFEFCYQSAT